MPAAFFRSVLGYMQGLPDEWIAAHNDLVRAARSGGQPFYRYMAACCEYGRQFARGELAAAGRTAAALDEIGSEFGPDATEGSYGMQMFMLQCANSDLEQVRSLIDGSEDTEDHWAPGLLTLYTELDMREAAARVLGELLLRRLDTYRQASAQWASVLVFMTDAAVLLDDVDAAARLRPLAAPYSGHNLVAGQFVATFGSADRSIGQLDSVLVADTADDHFERALDMDRRMGATLHQVETLGAWCRHAERRGGAADRRRDR